MSEKTCEACGERFDDAEDLIPTKYGYLCNDCLREYFDECTFCDSPIGMNEQQEEQKYIVIKRQLSGGQVFGGSELAPGVYRITDYPFIIDSMVEEQLDAACLEKKRELNNRELEALDEEDPCAFVCEECA